MRKVRLLMVEDETDILALNRQHLQAQGYEVHCAQTLAQARAILYEYPPDLILLDVLLPDGSGYDFCAEIRKLTTAPIIFLTCMAGDENTVKGLMAGSDDYICKPYNLDVLSARVMSALRRIGFSNPGRIVKPPLVIDHLTGHVTLDEMEIPLSQKEMQLLSFLVCHAGESISSDTLYQALWGSGHAPGTVRTHISNLRRKLLADSDYFDIVLVPGKGYMFVQTRYLSKE